MLNKIKFLGLTAILAVVAQPALAGFRMLRVSPAACISLQSLNGVLQVFGIVIGERSQDVFVGQIADIEIPGRGRG